MVYGLQSPTGKKYAKDRVRFTCALLGTVGREMLEVSVMRRGLRLAPRDKPDEHPWLSVPGPMGEHGKLTVEECEGLLRGVLESCRVKLPR